MLAHGLAVRNVAGPVLTRLVLVEERVAALVDDAVHAGTQILAVVGGDALVIRAHRIGEGVLGRRHRAAIKIKPDHIKEVAGHLFLGRIGDRAEEEVGADGFIFRNDLLKQGNQALLDPAEYAVELLGGHPACIEVEQVVVEDGLPGVLIHEQDLFLLGAADRVERGGEERIVAFFSRFDPVAVALVHDAGELVVLLGGDVFGMDVIPVKIFGEDPVELVKLVAVFIDILGGLLKCRGLAELENLVGEVGDDLAGLLHARRRAEGLHVKLHAAGSVRKEGLLLQDRVKAAKRLFRFFCHSVSFLIGFVAVFGKKTIA